MKISIFGLGYVGTVSAGCLAAGGHQVVGVDPAHSKVEAINAGRSPIIEKDIDKIIAQSVRDGLLFATADGLSAVIDSELTLVCVGTPSMLNGALDLKYVRTVCEEIGQALKAKEKFHIVVARSTMLPGTMKNVVIRTLEEFSGKKAGVDFGVCNNPEFLREGTAVYDFYHPPKTVIGEIDKKSGDTLASLYKKIDAPLIRTSIETAEMVKYADNVWHGLKIGFANEIGNICKELGIDSHRVMNIFCKDTKLNLSPYYMKPGFAFGGSCLPKDLRALTYKAKSMDVEVPILNAILTSNKLQIEKALKMVTEKGHRRIGILGFAFKAGTDDLRESPMVELIERLIGKGYELKLYDENVNMAKLVGANKNYILNRIPHISRLMTDEISEVIKHGDTLVIGNQDSRFKQVIDTLKGSKSIIDLVRIAEQPFYEDYDGICW